MVIHYMGISSVVSVVALLHSALAERAYLTPPVPTSLLSRLWIKAKVKKHDARNRNPDKNALPPSLPTPLRDTHVVRWSLDV